MGLTLRGGVREVKCVVHVRFSSRARYILAKTCLVNRLRRFRIARHSFSFITKARLKTLDMKHLHEAQGFSLNRKPFGVRHGSIYSGKAVPKNSRDRCRFCRFSASISRFDNNRDAELSNFLIRKEVQQPLDYF